MKTSHLGTALLSLAFAGAALAQNASSPADSSSAKKGEGAKVEFSTVDTNRDGRISQAEARSQGSLGTSFSTLDADKDSYLSQTEFGKWDSGMGKGGTSPSDSRTPQGMPTNPGAPSQPGNPMPGQPGSDATRTPGGNSPQSPGGAQ